MAVINLSLNIVVKKAMIAKKLLCYIHKLWGSYHPTGKLAAANSAITIRILTQLDDCRGDAQNHGQANERPFWRVQGEVSFLRGQVAEWPPRGGGLAFRWEILNHFPPFF